MTQKPFQDKLNDIKNT